MEKLDPASYRLLKRINKNKDYQNINSEVMKSREFNCLNKAGFLERDHLVIDINDDKPWLYKVGDKGIEYILNQKSDTLSKWKPLIISYVISAIAIVISIIALTK